jgi:CD2 antigen cytoplasmic tail-binding protein 2
MSLRTGKKRAVTSLVGAGEGSTSSGPTPKKTRFVEPSEDPAEFAEQVDSALEDPAAKRKGRVRTDGYDSDSTDDGEGVVLSRRKGARDGADGDGDDDDMFAVGEKEQKREEATGKKKKEEYLRLGDIEGQEFGRGSASASSGEEEPEDEDDAERRKKAGMGYELSSFNMREEMEEGKFAADGTYVRSFDPHGVHDRWMEGLAEKDIKLARRRKKERDRQQKEKIVAEERELEQSGGKDELEKGLVAMLKKGETVLEALQRLGARAKKNKTGNKRCARVNIPHTSPQFIHPPFSPTEMQEIAHSLATCRWRSTSRRRARRTSITSLIWLPISCPWATPTSIQRLTRSLCDLSGPPAKSSHHGNHHLRT